MPVGFEECWLSLSEAADLFSDAANPPHGFPRLLATGQVRILGTRPDRTDPEAIEDVLGCADEAPAFEISMCPGGSEIRLSLSRAARNLLGYGDLAPDPAIEGQLIDVFGAEWRKYWRSGLTFFAVQVGLASLRAAMVAAGYMLPEPAVAEASMRPAGYTTAWVPLPEALAYVQRTAGCSRLAATEALVMALRDSRIGSRNSDTGEKIDARDWFRVVFVSGEALLGTGRNEEIRRVELRREDVDKLWLDPDRTADEGASSAAPEPELLKPAPPSRIHQAIAEVYDDAEAGGEKPPNVKEIAAPVRVILQNAGYKASARQIQELASDSRHKGRRRKPGKTVASETRQ
jgi:hypothetical protein